MNNFQSANNRINQLAGVTKPLNKNTMNTLKSIAGHYNVTINGDLAIGCKIETTNKYGEYIATFCGEVVDIINGSLSVKSSFDDCVYSTVTSGNYKLHGATIEVIN